MTSNSLPQAQTSQSDAHTPSTRSNQVGGRSRGGRGRARGGEGPQLQSWAPDGGRGRGRGRGRGQGQRRESLLAEEHRQKLRAQLANSTAQAEHVAKVENSQQTTEDDATDADVCFICASPVVHNALSPCNHRTCHICALRLRALYKTKACAHCRTNADLVVFTDDKARRYEDFSSHDFSNTDDNLGIRYEKPEIFEDTVLLLRYNCPDESCDVACLGWPDLHRHVSKAHQKIMCDLCTRNKKVFTHEHELFTKNELRNHERLGDDNPGAEDQTGFRGHPECGFCRQRFYGDDELFTHCREKHERCHICDRRDGGRSQQYYLNYESLEDHFRNDHFLCPDRECLEKKFIVFESTLDLNAHKLEEHPNGLTKEARRDARQVDMTGFSLREQYNPRNERRGGQSQGRGRGRHPDAEPLPQSTAQPMRRDELAFQRSMAIQSAQSVTTRSFGGQLTPAPTQAATSAPRPTSSSANDTSMYPALGALTLGGSGNAGIANNDRMENSPAARARQIQHQQVNERAASLLRHDEAKIRQFRDRISSFKNSHISATELIDAFFTLFDTPSAELGKLVKELADIFEISQKKQELLKAWADWKAVNEDYPSLPGPSGAPAGSSQNPRATAAGGMRVLKLKSSTAQSGRSDLGRRGSLASTNGGGLNFPPLAAANGSTTKAKPGWWSSAAGSSSVPATANIGRAAPASSAAVRGTAPKPGNADAFPALPTAAKPTSTYFTPGSRGSAVKRDVVGWAGSNRPPTTSAWGAAAGTNGAQGNGVAEPVDDDTSEFGKRKGKQQGKKKVFLQLS